MKSKDFKKNLLLAFDVFKLDKKAIKKVAKDKNACKWGVLFVLLAGIAMAIGSLEPLGLIIYPIVTIIDVYIGVGLFWLFARMFGGKGDFKEQFRVQSFGYIAFWVGLIPVVGAWFMFPFSIWYLVVSVRTIEIVHKLSRGRAILSVVLPGLIIFLVMIFIIAAFAYSGVLAPDALLPQGLPTSGTF